MNITDYIVSLLKSGTNVELNGIGAFVVKSHDAYLDETTNTFYPKRQTIEFQPYSDNKGNIVQLIAKKECVSDNVAEKMWDNFYQALCDKIKSQSHEFPGVGTLAMDNGNIVFEPSEDAGQPNNAEMLQPITNVEKVNAVPDNDPFAVFDNPETLQEPESEPEPEPEPEVVPPLQPSNDEVITEEPTPEPAAEPATVVADSEPAAEPEPEPEPEPTPEPMDQPQDDDEQQTADALLEPQPQPSESENIADDLQNILDDETDNIDKSSKKDNKNRNYKIIIILLIVLMLLMWTCGLYYFFFINKNNQKSGEAQQVAAVEQTTNDNNGTNKDESATATSTSEENGTTPMTATTTGDFDYGKYANSFTYNPTFVELDNPNAVPDNREAILKRISGRLNSFLQSKQYSTATEKMKGKLTEFIDERLDEKLNNTGEFHFSQLFNGNQFAKDYFNDELKERKQKRARYEVIDEIFSNSLLSKYLNELIDAGEVQKDVAKAAPSPVYTAPIYSSSKQGFDVIAGTYRDKQSALKMASNLRSKGAGAYVIERGGLYYVSAGSAPSRTAVEKVMFQLKTWYTSNLSIKQW